MQSTWLSITGLFLITVLLALLAFHAGVRLGLWRTKQPEPEPNLPVRTMIASVLNLLAFILGFTFALAASHYDDRMETVFNEAVAIGTAYHRADFLPDPERSDVKRLLLKYVDLRLQVGEPAERNHTLERLNVLQAQILQQSLLIGNKDGLTGSASSAAQSLAEIIDVHALRVLTNMRARIPRRVWAALCCVMILGLAAAGYQCGLAGGRRSIAAFGYALVFAIVVVMIAMADNPGMEQFRRAHQPLFDLKARLAAPEPRESGLKPTEAFGLWK